MISDIFIAEIGQQQARAAPVFTPSPSGGRLGWGPAASPPDAPLALPALRATLPRNLSNEWHLSFSSA
jgi:hypothetical protein